MKDWKRGTRIVLLATLVLGIAAALLPSAGAIPSDDVVQEWVETPEAQERTQLGDCVAEYGANGVCKELCLFSDSHSSQTGIFDCFPG